MAPSTTNTGSTPPSPYHTKYYSLSQSDIFTTPQAPPPIQKMAMGFKSLLSTAKQLASGATTPTTPGTPGPAVNPAPITELFPKTNPAVDGEDCLHDCESCHVNYPRGFKIDESDLLYGHVNAWSTHVLVATGKTDWVRDVADEKGSVMQAFDKAHKPDNGKLMLSASNMPTPTHHNDYSEPTTILLLPAFTFIDNVMPSSVSRLVSDVINVAPTNTSALSPITLPKSLPEPLSFRDCPHSALILMCSQKTRDARCGQSAPLLRKELERHLRPLGLFRDLDDERPGGVGIYFISHVGGHKYSANMMVYRRPDAFGLDHVKRAEVDGEAVLPKKAQKKSLSQEEGTVDGEGADVGAAQCIWLARVKPEDCENIVKYTVLQGKVVKPESQLRGGFDRSRGVMSW